METSRATRTIIALYNEVVGGIETQAQKSDRAYGGVVRAAKGRLVENITRLLVESAWRTAGGAASRMTFDNKRKYRVDIQDDYLSRLSKDVADYIQCANNPYMAGVDLHVFIDDEIAMAVECKSYTENAMLKRILIDFRMLKDIHPTLICCLVQLESMLGRRYSPADPQQGSPRSHTLMSLFPDVDLNIITLLDGQRKVDQPIHKPAWFKNLRPNTVNLAIHRLSKLLVARR